MSEFKFACPVCGQHITADSTTSGTQLECPTCFREIIVPQAPTSTDPKFILSASQVAKPRPGPGSAAATESGPAVTGRGPVIALLASLVVLAAAGVAVYGFRDKLFNSSRATAPGPTNRVAKNPAAPPHVYPIPTNFTWTLDLTNAVIPETRVAGRIHGQGFFCEKAFLQGGALTLRQGKSGPADLALAVLLFADAGEKLSGKTIEIPPSQAPRQPRVLLRWKDDQQKSVTQSIPGGYALRVEFGEATNGRIPGKIYLCVPDETKSFAAGTFDAEIRKPLPTKAKPKG